MSRLPGRQMYFESQNDYHDPRRGRDPEFLRQHSRQLFPNQGYGLQLPELTPNPLPRDDGLRLDLNLIVLGEDDRAQSEDVYFRTSQPNEFNLQRDGPCIRRSFGSLNDTQIRSSQYLLEHIKQMEENYAIMERELMRARSLIPEQYTTPECQRAFDQQCQPEANWEECSLTRRYDQSCRNRSRLQEKENNNRRVNNQDRISVSAWDAYRTAGQRENSIEITTDSTDSINVRSSTKNPHKDGHCMRDFGNRICRPRTLENNATAVCSVHNIAIIPPQAQSNLSKYDAIACKETNVTPKSTSKWDITNNVFGGPRKYFSIPKSQNTSNFEKEEKASVETCQSFVQRQEPGTSRSIDVDVKQEDHGQISFALNHSKLQSVKKAGAVSNNGSERKSKSVKSVELPHSTTDQSEGKSLFEGTKLFTDEMNLRRENSYDNEPLQSSRRTSSNRIRKSPYDRIRSGKDTSRNSVRLVHKNVRGQKRTPIPRSTVHTTYNPTMPASSNPVLAPNEFTIQLLRLAVLLYAPALMPALNSLIYRQNSQASIPIPCFEDSNEFLSQVFRILNNQQCVPNLPYTQTSNARATENANLITESNLQPLSTNIEVQERREIITMPNSSSATPSGPKLDEKFKKCDSLIDTKAKDRIETNSKTVPVFQSKNPVGYINTKLLLSAHKAENRESLEKSVKRDTKSRSSETLIPEKRSAHDPQKEDGNTKNN